MKKNKLFCYLLAAMLTGFYACNKNANFNPQGGQLPTHYIQIKDSSFTPSSITEANGSSFTFLNQSTIPHTIMSDDTFTLKSVLILPDSFYFFKPDTATIVPTQIYIPYHCIEHPSARGVIILNP